MIHTFKDQTERFTDYEMEHILPRIVEILQSHKGSDHAIMNCRISELCNSIAGDAPRVRKIINYIRNKGLVPCLIASSKGYYRAVDAKEITDYEESLRGRESAIRKVRLSLHKQGVAVFGEAAISKAADETRREIEVEEKKYKLQLRLKTRRELKQEKKKKRKSVLNLRPKKRFKL